MIELVSLKTKMIALKISGDKASCTGYAADGQQTMTLQMDVLREELLSSSETAEYASARVFPECSKTGIHSIRKVGFIDPVDPLTILTYFILKTNDGADVLAVPTNDYIILGSSSYCSGFLPGKNLGTDIVKSK